MEGWDKLVSGRPDNDVHNAVRIYKPAQDHRGNPMTSCWRIIAEERGRTWKNQLMGWESTRDPWQSNTLKWYHFETKEAAIKWCENQGKKKKKNTFYIFHFSSKNIF